MECLGSVLAENIYKTFKNSINVNHLADKQSVSKDMEMSIVLTKIDFLISDMSQFLRDKLFASTSSTAKVKYLSTLEVWQAIPPKYRLHLIQPGCTTGRIFHQQETKPSRIRLSKERGDIKYGIGICCEQILDILVPCL